MRIVFDIIREIIDVVGLYQNALSRRDLNEENRTLRECIQMERMRNLSMEGQLSMTYSHVQQMHEEMREFHKMVYEAQPEEDDATEIEMVEAEEIEVNLKDRLASLEEALIKLSDKQCSCNRRDESLSGNLEEEEFSDSPALDFN